MKYKRTFGICLIVITMVAGCATCPSVDPQQKLITHFSDPMVLLAKAVNVVVDKVPPDSKDQEIFATVVELSGDPELIKPFEGYVLKVHIEDGYGVILLCSPDGKEGIIEDVTCTTRPDMFRPAGSPCKYLLDVKRVCADP
jgi:hypothetical protein